MSDEQSPSVEPLVWNPTRQQFLQAVNMFPDVVNELRRIGIAPDYIYGATLVLLERIRQVAVEGFDAQHDDDVGRHDKLAKAAAVYAIPTAERDPDFIREWWQWESPSFYKPLPDDRVRELVKAAALAVAALDYEIRQQMRKGTRT